MDLNGDGANDLTLAFARHTESAQYFSIYATGMGGLRLLEKWTDAQHTGPCTLGCQLGERIRTSYGPEVYHSVFVNQIRIRVVHFDPEDVDCSAFSEDGSATYIAFVIGQEGQQRLGYFRLLNEHPFYLIDRVTMAPSGCTEVVVQ